MTDIVFLTLEEVLALHDDAIAFAGGSSGVRSIDLLQGAHPSRAVDSTIRVLARYQSAGVVAGRCALTPRLWVPGLDLQNWLEPR